MSDDRPRQGPRSTSRGQPPLLLLKLLDLCLYGLAVAAVLVCLTAVVSFALGSGWGGSKYLLFVVGFLLFGLGSFGMRPRGAWKDDDDDDRLLASNDGESRFGALVHPGDVEATVDAEDFTRGAGPGIRAQVNRGTADSLQGGVGA